MIVSHVPQWLRGSLLSFFLLLPLAAGAGRSSDLDAAVPAEVAAAAKNLPITQTLSRGFSFTDDFGFSIAVNERFAVIGAPRQAAGEVNFGVGAVYVYARVNSSINQPWRFLHTIYGEDVDTTDANDDRFGHSVALSGTTLVVGSPGDDPVNQTPTARTGSIYVFTFNPTRTPVPGFDFRTKLRATSAGLAAVGNNFGESVAIAGSHLVVGAPGADGGASDAGAIALYTCTRVAPPTSITCTHRTNVASPDPNARGLFGHSVSAALPPRSSAAAVLVGAPNNCATGTCTTGPGAAYLFLVPPAGAVPAGIKITAPDGAPGDQFGTAVSVQGITAAIGAPGDNLGVGSTYVFNRTLAGTSFVTRLGPQVFQGMQFGSAVSLSGNHLAIGAPRRTVGTQPSQHGSVYVFERGRGQWFLRDEVFRTSSPIDTQVFFGAAVALGGGSLIVGEPQGPGVTFGRPGEAYAYVVGRSAKIAKVANPNGVGPAADRYGTDAAVSGGFMAVGLPHRQSPLGVANVGEVRLYQQTSGGAWAPTNQSAITFPEAAVAGARFGHSIAFSENAAHLIVGAPGAPAGAGGNAGAVYVFERQGATFLPAVQGAKLVRPNGVVGDDFGASIDVSPSANLLIVGAPEAGNGVGGVTIFRDPSAPAPKSGKVGRAKFDDGGNVPPPDGGGIGDKWGSSVATDGEQAVAGAPENGAGDDGGDGYATVIDDGGDGTFENTDMIDAPADSGAGDEQDFGMSVDIDDGTVAVGAPGTDMPDADDGGMNADEGVAYAYDVGGDPPQASDPTMLDPPAGDVGDKWGSSVAVDDGAVGAGGPGVDVPTDGGTSTDQGAVATYECYVNELGFVICEYDETLFGKNASDDEAIGSSIDMENGEIVLGAPDAGSADEGAVYVSEDLFAIDGLFRDGFE